MSGGDKTGGPPVKRQKGRCPVEFIIVARSSNTNSFGLHQYVAVNRAGDAYKIHKSLSPSVIPVNTVLQVPGEADFGALGFECAVQISEKMSGEALAAAWKREGKPESKPKVKKTPKSHRAPGIEEIMRYENGEMDEQTMLDFFQRMINSGLCWKLQGCYGRQASRLIETGWCKAAK